MITCSLPSNMSYMNLFIIEDLPTAWSPRKTILYLSKGGIVPFDKFKLLVLVAIIVYCQMFGLKNRILYIYSLGL